MTEQEKAWRRFTALPADAQQQVADLISFLHAHLGAEAVAEPEEDEAELKVFFGIWRGREDLHDSGGWVKGLREREWSSHR